MTVPDSAPTAVQRIGIFTHNYPPHPGGLEVIVHALATHQARDHDVVVMTTAWQGRRGVSLEDGVHVHRLPALHITESWDVPYAVPLGPGVGSAMAAMANRTALHAHGSLYATTLAAVRAKRRSGCPLIVTEHVGFVQYRSRVINLIQSLAWATVGRFVVRQAEALVAYNARVHDWLVQRFPSKIVRFIGNGVDRAAFSPATAERRRELRAQLGLPQDQVLALFVGRRSGKKNLDQVLAMPRRGWQLVVCGAERQLPTEAINLGLLPHHAMPELLASVDMMIHAATGEGFPVAVQEAMATGLPVVLLWDPGYSRSLDRECVAAGLDLASLAGLLEGLASSAEARKSLGEAARAWATGKWSWQNTVDSYLDLYASLRREPRA